LGGQTTLEQTELSAHNAIEKVRAIAFVEAERTKVLSAEKKKEEEKKKK
jgi:hypothetical protein